ncbi:MAG: hypothetical protein R3A12_04680 [Ignavibacteria bacterium]
MRKFPLKKIYGTDEDTEEILTGGSETTGQDHPPAQPPVKKTKLKFGFKDGE